MNLRRIALFLAYGTAVTIFVLYRHQARQNSLEEVRPYLHYYETSEIPETSVTETVFTIPETSAPAETIPETIPVLPEPETERACTETETITELPEIFQTEPLPETTEILFPIELNQATFEELCALPQIGAVTAQKIIDYRDMHSGFLNCEQLLEIPGIGEITYSLILPYLYLETEYSLPEPEMIPEVPELTEIYEPDLSEPPEENLPPEIPVINLNTAIKEELLLLPDCNEALADEIITLRDRDIYIFHNILEITLAENVTPELFKKWENYLTVDDDGSTQIPYIRPYGQESQNQD